ncbi:MAG: hypothetical protein HKL88_03060 [Bacteroidia bacterium]|nr:hypothetical protein [Bacteroidia bacterium]
MNVKRNINRTLYLCLAGLFLFGCRKNASWNTQLMVPLVNTSMSIGNLVTDSLVHKNPDSSVTLVYNGSLYNLNTDTLIKIPDTTINYYYPIFSSGTFNPGAVLLGNTGAYTRYGTGSVQLTKAIIYSGNITVEVSSSILGATDFIYSIPSATLGGNPFTVKLKVPAEVGANLGAITQSYNLANYNLDLTGQYHNGFNTLYTDVTASLDPADSPTAITAGQGFTAVATFQGLTPYYAQGYFGTITKAYSATSPFSIFSKITGGTLNLQSVNVSLSLQNYIGVDADITIDSLVSVNTHTGARVKLTGGNIIGNSVRVGRASQTYNPNNPVSPVFQTFSLTPSNSNIISWINNLPNQAGYSAHVTTDPLGNVSGSNDFAFKGYGIQSNLNISIPLSLVASNLTLADTVSLNLGGNTGLQNIQSGTLTIYAVNGFPFSTGLQFYLLDNNLHVTDSLCSTVQPIASGNMNALGVVINTVPSVVRITLNEAQTRLLFNANRLLIKAVFNMGSPSPLTYRKIYSYNTLSLNVVGNFNYLAHE